jgi:Peptidase family C25
MFMKKFIPVVLCCLSFLAGKAQLYNNEWIDYSKTYYKFKAGADGLYRITQPALSAIGLGSTPAQHFQLWRNGKQVALYTSVATGTMGGGDYIEFWGLRNDGEGDKSIYRDIAYQHTDKVSLHTDTASYFLTVNPAGGNLRYNNTPNNITGSPTPEPYFMHVIGNYFKNRLNPGFAAVVGEYVYSSSYDKGEFWSSNEIFPGFGVTVDNNNLFIYNAGPAAYLRLGVAGNALNPRNVLAKINGNTVINQPMDLFDETVMENNAIPLSYLDNTLTRVEIQDSSYNPNDRMCASFFELMYPRQFNFGGQKTFTFEMPQSATARYLEITNFNAGTSAPILYDLTGNKRYVTQFSGGIVKVMIEPSAVVHKFVLVSQDASNITSVNSFVTRNFVNYTAAANQGDYLIISNTLLFNGANGTNPVDQYRAYRASVAGGGYNAKIYDIDQLVDQYGWGIKKHPNSVRNFIRHARATFSAAPKFVFIIGRGVSYYDYRRNESNALADRLNLVPSFGFPASDMLLSAPDLLNATPGTPIGRLSAVIPDEVRVYLDKIIEYEAAQANPSCNIADKGWMKNVVHVVGASDDNLRQIIEDYMLHYRNTISDTLFGANVTTFSKTSANSVQQLNNSELERLFAEGISLITYFGHSSASTLEFNLDDPSKYNNQGKYPLFLVNGCNAGNIFTFNTQRFSVNESLSEKYVLAKNRGGIGFVASTHFGIVNYLNIYSTGLYDRMSRADYGKPVGNIMRDAISEMFTATSPDDYYSRMHAEQTTLNGDPAIKINNHALPDYVIEDPMVRVNPAFISIAEDKFLVKSYFRNNGRVVNDSVFVEVKRQYPDGSIATVYKQKIRGIRFIDSLNLELPIVPTRDKGTNRITVTIDAENNVNEGTCEGNNTVTKEFQIYEDELRPVYPYTYSIINQAATKLVASTANPLGTVKPYVMEMDTTELFNSPLKITRTASTAGGIIEFDPGITYLDSTVYYWRTAPVPPSGNAADYRWNTASFMYLNGTVTGFNQSHYFQHLKSGTERIKMAPNRRWKYDNVINNLFVRSGAWVTSTTQEAEMSVAVNGEPYIRNACMFSTLVFNVFDPVTFKPWENQTVGGQGLYGSWLNDCFPGREHNFEFRYAVHTPGIPANIQTPLDTADRHKAMNFMDNVIPDGAYVVVRGFVLDSNRFGPTWPQANVNHWKNDTTYFGSGNSIYHRLKSAGFNDVDSFYKIRSFIFVYKKGATPAEFTPRSTFSQGTFDKITLSVDCPTPDTLGFITSPKFGPARTWQEIRWRGNSNPDVVPGDAPLIDVIGVTPAGADSLLYTLDQSQQDFNIASVDAATYPYIKLRMKNQDSVNLTPYQLRYWRILYDPIPEGAIASNVFVQMKDTLDAGEILNFGLAFKNISNITFSDSMLVSLKVVDNNNVVRNFPLPKFKKINPGDTIRISQSIDTRTLVGTNTLIVDVNPNNAQPEQYHFNNFMYRNFFVKGDNINPLLDVTFDGVHILNRDVVSPKPHILIKLKDEARFLPLDDTSLFNISIRYPDNVVRSFRFGTDTARFTPAVPGGAENAATVDLSPFFPMDGDYELIVSAKDKTGNRAGPIDYRVIFQVINKPMISNLLNYPNPFTTSTAFVFTLTGSEIPQQLKIQIMTVTGKIVREITQDELGPIRIGRNITQFKWDGTDQFGGKLANGIYLYRVVTNLNGSALEKYKARGDNTDKFFKGGYGKMYLMR